MIRITRVALVLLSCLPAMVFAQTYKCRQADGSLSYQDRACQAGATSSTIAAPAAGPSRKSTGQAADAAPSYADKLRDNERRHIADEAKAQSQQVLAVQRAQQCNADRQQLGILREQRPVFNRDNAGERQYIDDKDRPREIVAARQRIAEDCP